MKYLPDTFPIRYAIAVRDMTEGRSKDKYFNEIGGKVLWDQLIEFLQTTPLAPEHLAMQYTALNYTYRDAHLCHIPRLVTDREWCRQGVEELSKVVPEGRFSEGPATAFYLGLISYEGMGEQPFFWQLYTKADDEEYIGKVLGLRYWGHIRQTPEHSKRAYEFYMGYEKRGDYWQYEQMKVTGSLKVYDLRVPYSPLWALLDKSSKLNGCIPPTSDIEGIDRLTTINMQDKPEYINVVLVKGVESLIWEEVSALYRLAAFCNNCGRLLPFDRKNKYCPEKLNPDCTKTRARKRAQKKNKKFTS